MDSTVADPLVGTLVDGRYEIVDRIARGGMATVYEAIDTRLERTVAIKIMHRSLAEDPDFVSRFVREARSAARLTHPNVVSVYDQGTDAVQDLVFLVMEHVPSRTLRDVLRERGRLTLQEAFDVAEPVLSALGAAHRAGLVHRDVKPENVLLAEDGRVMVADFGLARATSTSTSATTQGVLIGTVAYLAPEQVERGVADARSDVYAAGILLFEMLTGAPPFGGETPLAVAYQHVNGVVPPPSQQVSGLPSAVDALLASATARDPDGRYSDADRFLAALRATRSRLGLPPWTGSVSSPAAPLTDTLVVERSGDLEALHGDAPAPGPGRRRARRAAGTAVGSAQDEIARWSRSAAVQRRRAFLVLVLVLALAVAIGVVAFRAGAASHVDVPSVTGRSADEAVDLLRSAGLEPVRGEAVFSDTVAKGLVAATDPEPGSRVREGSEVTFLLSKGRDLRKVPPIKDRNEKQFRAAVTEAGLEPVKDDEKYSDTVPKGDVISVRPEPGKALAPGTRVAYVVSKGPAPVKVPRLVGRSESAARSLLAGRGLRAAVEKRTSETVPAGAVISQSAEPGATLLRTQTVTIVVSSGPPPVEVPNLVGLSKQAAEELLRSRGLVPRGRYATPGLGAPVGLVRTQDVGAGSSVPKGSTVGFTYV